jgi:DNA polymerase
MERAVSRDAHKAKAFVRFRRIDGVDGDEYVAWHRPDHRILKLVAPFFSRRFPEMHWSILTPEESVLWDGQELHYGPGVPSSEAPDEDALEDLWRTYYGSVFNPARIKVKTMKREMPVRHWATLPETRVIPQLLEEAPTRVAAMRKATANKPRSAADFLPETRTLRTLAAAAKHCEGCELYQKGTQTVFGEGSKSARIIFVGEQPGDQEDVQGHPFVGPAGKVLDDALLQAGIDRSDVYVTNAVKHFNWEPRGERRLHKKPPARAMAACKPWLEAEVEVLRPEVIVCLGATAAQSVIGREARITHDRGRILESSLCHQTIMTWHPSAVLRAPDATAREKMRSELIHDLKTAAKALP